MATPARASFIPVFEIEFDDLRDVDERGRQVADDTQWSSLAASKQVRMMEHDPLSRAGV